MALIFTHSNLIDPTNQQDMFDVFKNVADRILGSRSVTVMARTALQRALDQQWIDASFERKLKQQYSSELLFSTVIVVIENVVTGGPVPPFMYPHAIFASVNVSISTLYEKPRTRIRIGPCPSRSLKSCRYMQRHRRFARASKVVYFQ
ncbi:MULTISPECIES: hypothetical protein [unclassified Caballeronia]|uniref:hypothetical protein n=1 Tax=unclassified Caballeronia TaxID=2646786 RepID=UPI002027C6D4|nr:MULTISPECIES: hypothetical protein [unclassified Caballeronia]